MPVQALKPTENLYMSQSAQAGTAKCQTRVGVEEAELTHQGLSLSRLEAAGLGQRPAGLGSGESASWLTGAAFLL